jgi:hypothetical protein
MIRKVGSMRRPSVTLVVGILVVLVVAYPLVDGATTGSPRGVSE